MDNSEFSTGVNDILTISNFLSTESKDDLVCEIYKGLSAKQKYISSRFFYDENGSMLFEEITALPEYYPSRTEISILKANAQNIIGDFEQLDIIELGSGDCSKISILLDAIPKNRLKNINYIPVDVSETAIFKSADILTMKYPGMNIHGLLADFLKHLDRLPGEGNRLICFFGSTLGNLTRKQSAEFLSNFRQLMKPGDKFLLGLDMVKDRQVLYNAYNDKQGITALFNKNILHVINETVNTNFNTEDFNHLAWYNEKESRIEMHLKANMDMEITSKFFPKPIIIYKGETIHTENSHKFTPELISQLGFISGLELKEIFKDDKNYFSLLMFKYPK